MQTYGDPEPPLAQWGRKAKTPAKAGSIPGRTDRTDMETRP